jgi:Ca2+-transporting ATPase
VLASGAGVVTARNVVLLLMVLFENVFVFAVHTERRPAYQHLTRNRLLLVGTVVAQGIHILAMQLEPTQRLLGVAPVSAGQWLALLGLALILPLAVEAHKAWVRRRQPSPTRARTTRL